jgi:uncharacterized membrane protein YtjA (UPF0391 family)
MLRMALAFLVLTLLAAALGFMGIAIAAAGIARILFFIFLLLCLFSLGGHIFSGASDNGQREVGNGR